MHFPLQLPHINIPFSTLKKIDCVSFSSRQLPIAPQLGGLYLIPAGMWMACSCIGLVLTTHSWCKLLSLRFCHITTSQTALPPPTSGFCTLSIPPLHSSLDLCRMIYDINVYLRTQLFRTLVIYSLHFGQWSIAVSTAIN